MRGFTSIYFASIKENHCTTYVKPTLCETYNNILMFILRTHYSMFLLILGKQIYQIGMYSNRLYNAKVRSMLGILLKGLL
jgi:hypothetical protein